MGSYSDGSASPAESTSSDGRSLRGDGSLVALGIAASRPRHDLAPLHSLKRNHPYRRDPVDDKTLRLLASGARLRLSSSPPPSL